MIEWAKGVSEVGEEKSAVTVPIIVSHKQVDILFMWLETVVSERVNYLRASDPALCCSVEHLISVHQIEIMLSHHSHFCVFDLPFVPYLFPECKD